MAYSNSQLRGALLEEAILYLLKKSGYTPVLSSVNDPTLETGSSGLEVKGRGAKHQIDAIADFKLTPPFSNPQRLLLEAKFYADKVNLQVVRNAAGVLKDVSENWVIERSGPREIAKKRFHYLYAIFSASDFTTPAQDYAYAQDIYLLPLRRSIFFRPVVEAIDRVSNEGVDSPPELKFIRYFIRSQLFNVENAEGSIDLPVGLRRMLIAVVDSCRAQNFAFIAMLGMQFPVFLVASPEYNLELASGPISVRVRWRNGNWFIENENGVVLFSFDLPDEIYQLYAERGKLRREMVADIKSNIMREFYAFYTLNDGLRLIHFILDNVWFEAIRKDRH